MKSDRLAQARAALAMPVPNPQAREDVAAFMRRVAAIDIGRCPLCCAGRLVPTLILQPLRSDPMSRHPVPACRGPPP